MKLSTLITTNVLLILASSANAHEGHGLSGISHDIYHAGLIALTGLVVIVLAVHFGVIKRKKK